MQEVEQWRAVNAAFSKQSLHFDAEDEANPILQDWRKRVYAHVDRLIKPNSRILELNAGTGIDAIRFAKKGHRVHATDLSDGMIEQMQRKVHHHQLADRMTVQKISYEQVGEINETKFDFVFSNFGGLNCCDDLSKVTQQIASLLHPGAVVTWVIMPPVCVWEMASILKGNRNAFRRLNKNGVVAHLEGEYFRTWYHSIRLIKKAFKNFRIVAHEGLGAITPPPHSAAFIGRHPNLYKRLRSVEDIFTNYFPFNRWADHIIVSFQYAP